MSTRSEVLKHLNLVGQLQPALHKQTHAPYPDEINHSLYRAYTRSAHDVGGEPMLSQVDGSADPADAGSYYDYIFGFHN